jgi:hypothetical protein
MTHRLQAAKCNLLRKQHVCRTCKRLDLDIPACYVACVPQSNANCQARPRLVERLQTDMRMMYPGAQLHAAASQLSNCHRIYTADGPV